jgi:hypothetical protein
LIGNLSQDINYVKYDFAKKIDFFGGMKGTGRGIVRRINDKKSPNP